MTVNNLHMWLTSKIMGTEENAEAQSILFCSPMIAVITLYHGHGKTPMDCHLHTA